MTIFIHSKQLLARLNGILPLILLVCSGITGYGKPAFDVTKVAASATIHHQPVIPDFPFLYSENLAEEEELKHQMGRFHQLAEAGHFDPDFYFFITDGEAYAATACCRTVHSLYLIYNAWKIPLS